MNPENALKRRAQGHQLNLDDAACLASWPTLMAGTPATETYNEAGTTDSSRKTVELVVGPRYNIRGKKSNGCPAATASGGQLNPAHSRWLMGYPREWDDCAPTATRSTRGSPRRSSLKA